MPSVYLCWQPRCIVHRDICSLSLTLSLFFSNPCLSTAHKIISCEIDCMKCIHSYELRNSNNTNIEKNWSIFHVKQAFEWHKYAFIMHVSISQFSISGLDDRMTQMLFYRLWIWVILKPLLRYLSQLPTDATPIAQTSKQQQKRELNREGENDIKISKWSCSTAYTQSTSIERNEPNVHCYGRKLFRSYRPQCALRYFSTYQSN